MEGSFIGKICEFCKKIISRDHHERTMVEGKTFCCIDCTRSWEEQNPPQQTQ
jgi:hypothetical protein